MLPPCPIQLLNCWISDKLMKWGQRWTVVDYIQTSKKYQVEPVPPQPADLCCCKGKQQCSVVTLKKSSLAWHWAKFLAHLTCLVLLCPGSPSAAAPCTILPAAWFRAAASTFSYTSTCTERRVQVSLYSTVCPCTWSTATTYTPSGSVRPGKVDSQFIIPAHTLFWEIPKISFFIISCDHHVGSHKWWRYLQVCMFPLPTRHSFHGV